MHNCTRQRRGSYKTQRSFYHEGGQKIQHQGKDRTRESEPHEEETIHAPGADDREKILWLTSEGKKWVMMILAAVVVDVVLTVKIVFGQEKVKVVIG